MPKTLDAESVSTMPGRPADARITAAQIGTWTLASVGARNLVRDDDNGLLMFRVGTGPTLRKMLVRLMPSDTYAVEVGRMHRRTLAWIVEHQTFDVYAEDLSATVRDALADALD